MMQYIFLFFLSSIYSFGADFVRDDESEMILDTSTSLVWQDTSDAKVVKKNFNEAIEYCDTLVLVGLSDWRLPNLYELYLLADRSKSNPALSEEFHYYNIDSIRDFYWSSTTNVEENTTAWGIYFHYGNSVVEDKNSTANVRCVRNGK